MRVDRLVTLYQPFLLFDYGGSMDQTQGQGEQEKQNRWQNPATAEDGQRDAQEEVQEGYGNEGDQQEEEKEQM